MPHCREHALDRVRSSQVVPMIGGKVEEHQQASGDQLDQAFDCTLSYLGAYFSAKRRHRRFRRAPVRRQPDLAQILVRVGLRRLRELVEHVQCLVQPASLMTRRQERLRSRALQNPSAPSPMALLAARQPKPRAFKSTSSSFQLFARFPACRSESRSAPSCLGRRAHQHQHAFGLGLPRRLCLRRRTRPLHLPRRQRACPIPDAPTPFSEMVSQPRAQDFLSRQQIRLRHLQNSKPSAARMLLPARSRGICMKTPATGLVRTPRLQNTWRPVAVGRKSRRCSHISSGFCASRACASGVQTEPTTNFFSAATAQNLRRTRSLKTDEHASGNAGRITPARAAEEPPEEPLPTPLSETAELPIAPGLDGFFNGIRHEQLFAERFGRDHVAHGFSCVYPLRTRDRHAT